MKPEFLRPCDHVWGKAKLIAADPDISLVCGATYVPFDPSGVWGIFNRDGLVAEGTLDRYGASGELSRQSIEYKPPDPDAWADAPDNEYVYGGQIHYHFGHFFINTLSRMWPEFIMRGPRPKILMHGPGNVAEWFSHGFIKEAFGAIGLSESDVIKFDTPIVVPRLIVPFPAFQDVAYVHSVFGRLCRRIGERLLWNVPRRGSDRPVYLSKSGTPVAGLNYTNEHEVISILASRGIEIIVPEALSLGQKARIFEESRCVSGFASSGMHSAIFAPPNARGVFLNVYRGVNANFYMFDLLTKQKTEYYHAPGTVINDASLLHPKSSVIIAEPSRVARDLLALIESSGRV